MRYVLLLLFFCPQLIKAQAPLDVLKPLMGKVWTAEEKWESGTQFKQKIELKYALDKQLILVTTYGFLDKEQTEFGIRNHGVRQWDASTHSLRFWEFDIQGGKTEGTVTGEGKNIRYDYAYGDLQLTDLWEYIDENTYKFTVGEWENGTWKKVYLQTTFTGKTH